MKKRIAWEIMDGSRLKSKIEVSWSEIIGMRAVLRDRQSGILELEVRCISWWIIIACISC